MKFCGNPVNYDTLPYRERILYFRFTRILNSIYLIGYFTLISSTRYRRSTGL